MSGIFRSQYFLMAERDHAMELARTAVAADTAGEYSRAHAAYMRAITALVTLASSDPSMQLTITSYMDRAEALAAHLQVDNPSPPSPAQPSEARQQTHKPKAKLPPKVLHRPSPAPSAPPFPAAASHPLGDLIADPSIAGLADAELHLQCIVDGRTVTFDGTLPTTHRRVHTALMELLRAAAEPDAADPRAAARGEAAPRGPTAKERNELPKFFPSNAAESKRAGGAASAVAPASSAPGAAATKTRSNPMAAARAEAAAAVPASQHVDLIEMTPSQPGWLEREEALLREVEARGDPVTEATPAGAHTSTVEYIPMAQRADDAVLKEADVSVRIVTKTGFDIVRCVVITQLSPVLVGSRRSDSHSSD